MLLGSDFILNQVSARNSISIAPFIHCFDNNINNEKILKQIKIPDSVAVEEIP